MAYKIQLGAYKILRDGSASLGSERSRERFIGRFTKILIPGIFSFS